MTETQKKFLEKFNEIFGAYTTGNETYKTIADPLKSKRAEQESIANLEKTTAFFKMLVNALPEDKKDQVYSAFEQKYIAQVGTERYNKIILPSVVAPRFPTPESRKYHLFYSIPNSLIQDGTAREIVEQVIQYVDDGALLGMINEIDAFQSDIIHNVKIEFFRKRVDELKKINAERIKDENKLQELNEELEKVAKTAITSSPRYSDAQGEVQDKIYRQISEDRIDELNEKMLSQPEYKHFREYFEVESDGKYKGSRTISYEHREDTAMADAFTADNVKLTFTPEIKESMRKVLRYMSEHNMLRDNADIGEQKIKIYGFAAISEAHDKLANAIEGTDVEEIRKARTQYETEIESMRGLYELIKTEFKPTPEMMIGNVITYRTPKIPNEFKNDIVLNALVSGFFNLHAALAQQNKSLDQMFENPGKVFLQVVKGFSKGVTAGACLKEQNIAQSIKTLTIASPQEFPGYGLARNMEFLQAITYGSDSYEKNSLGTMLFSSYASRVGNVVFDTDGNSVTTMNYLRVSPVETLANVLLVNDEDRDYDKLRAVESTTIDCTEKIPAFDTLKYLETHTIDVGALINRFKATLTELYAQKHFQRNEYSTKNTAIADTIRAAQFAAYQFLMVHPEPYEFGIDITEEVKKENERNWEELKRIVAEPEVVFADCIDDKIKEALDKRMPKHKMLGAELKVEFDAARIAERKAEKSFLDKTAKTRKEFAELSEKFGTGIGEEADKVRKEYSNANGDLQSFKVKELQRLRESYDKGYMSTSYYEQRRHDINAGNIDKFIPFDVNEYFAIARDDARKAEKAYEKAAASLVKQVNSLSKKLGKGNEKAEQQYEQAQSRLDEVKKAELKRLDKDYADGKLTQSYYDERRYNVETGNLKKTVPFGVDDAPKFSQFKSQYKKELDNKELSIEDVQMFYDRMMDRMRIDEFKLKQIASGGYPKPALQVSKLASREFKVDKLFIPEAMGDEFKNSNKSPEVVIPETKHIEKIIN